MLRNRKLSNADEENLYMAVVDTCAKLRRSLLSEASDQAKKYNVNITDVEDYVVWALSYIPEKSTENEPYKYYVYHGPLITVPGLGKHKIGADGIQYTSEIIRAICPEEARGMASWVNVHFWDEGMFIAKEDWERNSREFIKREDAEKYREWIISKRCKK